MVGKDKTTYYKKEAGDALFSDRVGKKRERRLFPGLGISKDKKG